MEKLIGELKPILEKEEYLKNEISTIENEIDRTIKEENDNDRSAYEEYMSGLESDLKDIEEKKNALVEERKSKLKERQEKIEKDIIIAKEDLEDARKAGNDNNILVYEEYLSALEEDLVLVKEELENINNIDFEKIKEEMKREEEQKRRENDPRRKELAYLKSIVDDPDLDAEDMPDLNRQEILNRIAQLEGELGKEDIENEKTTEKPKEVEDDKFQPPAVREGDRFQPPAVKEGDRFQPPAVIERPPEEIVNENLPTKTGLQIFRDEFNKMPYIENKHTLTERLPLPTTLGTVAGVGLLAVNPFVGVPVTAASLLAKPILYRLTGQKKIEEEITQQFLEMEKEDLEKMVDYLSEEKIQDLKPNAVILRSLHKAMMEVTRQNSKDLKDEKANLQSERQELFNKENLSMDENNRLMEINDRIKEINEVEAPKVERRLKEVKRGKDRVSQRYKGNLATKFNIFAHRNTTSEQYYPEINKLANAEMFRDVARAEENAKSQAESQMMMEQVMADNTHKNSLGIQNSIFNERKNVVRIMSDRLDNTVRYIGRIGTIATGAIVAGLKLKEFENAQDINAVEHSKIVSEHNQNIGNLKTAQSEITNGDNISQELAQKVADEQKTIAGAYGESAALHNTSSTSAANYFEQDQLTQDQLTNVGKTISEKDSAGILHQLAEAVKSRSDATSRLNNEAMNKINNNTWRVDHTEELASQINATEQANATATLYENMAKIMEKVQKIQISKVPDNFVKVANSYIGPIISGIGLGLGVGKDMSDSKKEKKHNREANELVENEERD